MSEKVLVLGLGKSGIAVARHLLATGQQFCIYAGSSSLKTTQAAQEFLDAGIEVVFDSEEIEGHYELCVVCPGIPQTSSFYQNAKAASEKLISEPEFAFEFSPYNWIAVTGTNGKTTCTSCIAHVLNECGTKAYACGNIGKTTTESAEQRKPSETLVAEMSSFQLASTSSFDPSCALLLNITPDHIKWHGSFEAYTQAKFKIFQNLHEGQTAVICDGIEGISDQIRLLKERNVHIVYVGSEQEEDCAFQHNDKLYIKLNGVKHELCHVQDLKIKGNHNVINALAVAACAVSYGLSVELVAKALGTFEPLEHRIEPVAELGGVAFYNDSKATNVDATLQALTAFPNQKIHLLLGGTDKGTSLNSLVFACEKSCAEVICYGEAGKRFADAFQKSPLRSTLCVNMEEAFNLACNHAKAGNVVLLSPACASFDEFDSFVHRGNVFKELVHKRDERA